MSPRGENSIKDPERYEALRRKNMSKEKAARIANTPAEVAGRRGGKARNYDESTKTELVEKAKRIGITGYSRMNKDELIKALRHH